MTGASKRRQKKAKHGSKHNRMDRITENSETSDQDSDGMREEDPDTNSDNESILDIMANTTDIATIVAERKNTISLFEVEEDMQVVTNIVNNTTKPKALINSFNKFNELSNTSTSPIQFKPEVRSVVIVEQPKMSSPPMHSLPLVSPRDFIPIPIIETSDQR